MGIDFVVAPKKSSKANKLQRSGLLVGRPGKSENMFFSHFILKFVSFYLTQAREKVQKLCFYSVGGDVRVSYAVIKNCVITRSSRIKKF